MVTPDLDSTRARARRIREHALRMVHRANASHIGSGLSMADILAVLYGGVVRADPSDPRAPDRDRVILSKGHGAAAFYATLAEAGYFDVSLLETFCRNGSPLAGHVSHRVPGVDFSTGSLGHGLSLGCGVALGFKRDGKPGRAFVILSDGECDEGSTWEAALFGPHHALDNLVAIVDYNKIQSFGAVQEVLDLEPFADKWSAFRWNVQVVDGHDHAALAHAFAVVPTTPGRPSVIIAHTVKGKGVSFMEGNLLWHYRAPDGAQLEAAVEEVRSGR
jgi:transketolase